MDRPRGSALLLILLVCHAVAVLFFCKGFLLRRVVIPEYSNCTRRAHIDTSHRLDEEDQRYATRLSDDSCHYHPRKFKRVVWLLVDALRYDFAEYDATLDPVPVYRNKLPFVRDLLRERPRHAKLFRFVADPPTTTMQRLKALTTGSLPTFIDIGENFNSHQITEDSLPFQVKANGRNVTFIGDDTWLGLYGGLLTKVFDYPSLNVKDLHTVDNGVVEHMVPELEKRDAEFVVGHFLGVDHVGHTYGSTHWTMGEKLSQMNEVLKSIFEAVDEETIVFVFGDHGMTASGDHGGETELETTAALLVYTPSPLFPPTQHSGRSLYQIDIVPTVSLLLGIPIPFSNLGMIIPEVFLPWQTPEQEPMEDQPPIETSDGYKGRVTVDFLTALQLNAEQVQQYLKTYIKHSDDFPSDVYNSLREKFARAQELHVEVRAQPRPSQKELTTAAVAYVDYMRQVKAMCHDVWAKFDDLYIYQGILLFTLTLLTTLLTLFDVDLSITLLGKNLGISSAVGVPLSLLSLIVSPLPLELGVGSVADVALSLSFYPLLIFATLQSFVIICNIYEFVRGSFINQIFSVFNRLSFTYVFSTVLAVGCSVSLISNSFILYEGDMTVFFIQSMLICFLVQKAQSLNGRVPPPSTLDGEHLNGGNGKSVFSLYSALRASWPLLLTMVLARLSKVFHACRDLQVGCEATSFTQPYHGAVGTLGWLASVRLVFSCVGVLCVPLSLAGFVRYYDRLSRHLGRWVLLCVYVGLPLSSLCVCGFWLVQTLPQPVLDSLPHWQHVALPRVVYAVSLSTILACILAPFNRSKTKSISSSAGKEQQSSVLSEYGRQSLNNDSLRHRTAVTTSPATQHSDSKKDEVKQSVGWSVVLPGSCVVYLALLVALWLPVAMVLNDGVALSALLLAVQLTLLISSLYQSQEVSWPVVVLWGLVCSQFFFGFGHHATVVSLRFEAGFVGLHGEMSGLNLLCAGLLVGVNMLGSHLLLGLSLPLLPLLSVRLKSTAHSKQILITVALQYIMFHSFKTLLTMVTASVQRRHLMVWGVFSPRFLYEAAFLGASHVSVIITFLISSSLASRDPTNSH